MNRLPEVDARTRNHLQAAEGTAKSKLTKKAGNILDRCKPLDSTSKDQLTPAEISAIESIGVSLSDLFCLAVACELD